jgi:hypothetical protein
MAAFRVIVSGAEVLPFLNVCFCEKVFPDAENAVAPGGGEERFTA